MQNQYNLVTRGSEDVLDYCEKHSIGFIPWFPLAAGDLAKPGSLLDGIAKKHKATPAQIALAWVLKRSPVMLPIPGTGKVKHLEENVAAADIVLSDEEFTALDREEEEITAAKQLRSGPPRTRIVLVEVPSTSRAAKAEQSKTRRFQALRIRQ